MPRMDGLAATRKIRLGAAGKKNTDIAIVALTAYASHTDRQHFLDSGMDDSVAKPADERALAERPDCDDVLLLNERGEVTESSRASLVLLLDGELVTPRLSCGLLPGVFRERLLRLGIVRERVILPADVLRAARAWLVNSVRWWMACEAAR